MSTQIKASGVNYCGFPQRPYSKQLNLEMYWNLTATNFKLDKEIIYALSSTMNRSNKQKSSLTYDYSSLNNIIYKKIQRQRILYWKCQIKTANLTTKIVIKDTNLWHFDINSLKKNAIKNEEEIWKGKKKKELFSTWFPVHRWLNGIGRGRGKA